MCVHESQILFSIAITYCLAGTFEGQNICSLNFILVAFQIQYCKPQARFQGDKELLDTTANIFPQIVIIKPQKFCPSNAL